MQQLHLVGFTTELDGLIFSARKGSKSGSFVVKIDGGLLSTLDDVQRLRAGDSPSDDGAGARSSSSSTGRPRPESTLSPREIQSRLRGGSTIAEVAATAGVDEEWVSRFAAPILAEQHQVVVRARNLVFAKARLGDSAYPLGPSVLLNLADRGIRLTEDAFESGWRAWNLHGAVWIVQFAYTSRQRGQAAEWEVDLRDGTLHNRNRLAADLGHVEPGRRRRSVPQFEPPAHDAADSAGSGRRGRGRQKSGTAGPTPSQSQPAPARAAGQSGAPARKKSSGGRTSTARPTAKKAGVAKKAGASRKAGAAKKSSATRKKPGAAKKSGAARRTTSAAKKSGGTTRAAATRATVKRASAKPATAKRATPKRAPTKRAATRTTAAKRGPAKKAPAAGPPPRPRAVSPLEERVSHLARPASPPTRRGAARDGTPVIGPRGSTSRGADQTRTDRPRRPPAQSAPPPARLERVRGRPAEPAAPERGGSRSSASTGPRASSPAERSQASRDPVTIPVRSTPTKAPTPTRAPLSRPASAPSVPSPSAASPGPAPRPSAPPPSPTSRAASGPRLGPDPLRAAPVAAPSPRPPERSRPPAPRSEPRSESAPSRPTRTADRPAETAPPDRLARRFARRSTPGSTSASNGGPREGPNGRAAEGERGRGPAPARADEPVWHGPDSGEPAPPMRIRADLAAAASARNDEARRVRRSAGRDRPLRAR